MGSLRRRFALLLQVYFFCRVKSRRTKKNPAKNEGKPSLDGMRRRLKLPGERTFEASAASSSAPGSIFHNSALSRRCRRKRGRLRSVPHWAFSRLHPPQAAAGYGPLDPSRRSCLNCKNKLFSAGTVKETQAEASGPRKPRKIQGKALAFSPGFILRLSRMLCIRSGVQRTPGRKPPVASLAGSSSLCGKLLVLPVKFHPPEWVQGPGGPW